MIHFNNGKRRDSICLKFNITPIKNKGEEEAGWLT